MIKAAMLAVTLLPNIEMAQIATVDSFGNIQVPDGVGLKRLDCRWVADEYHCTLDPKQVVIDNLNDFIKPEISGANDESKLTCVGIDGSEFRICKPSNGK